jgi:chemotaxis protein methyltransferase CheR
MNDLTSSRTFEDGQEYRYTEQDFEAIATMVHAHAGICMPEGKAMLIYSRLAKFLREKELRSFAEYVNIIRNDSAERARAIEALTTNHTKFFREIHHFDHFEQHLRRGYVDRVARGERLRIWSSAASSGEEIYSLAMCLLGTDMAEARRICEGDVALLATDLAEHVLRTAETGIYPASLKGDIPARYAQPWTRSEGQRFTVAQPLRNLIRFRRLNLLNAWPIKGQFDLILCRNVMIYFDEPTKELLLKRLADQLVPGGILYIGHSERLVGPAAQQLVSVGQTIYRKGAA